MGHPVDCPLRPSSYMRNVPPKLGGYIIRINSSHCLYPSENIRGRIKSEQCADFYFHFYPYFTLFSMLLLRTLFLNVENEHSFFLAELNAFSCCSNIYKLFNDKRSNCKHSAKLFMKKFNVAKVSKVL